MPSELAEPVKTMASGTTSVFDAFASIAGESGVANMARQPSSCQIGTNRQGGDVWPISNHANSEGLFALAVTRKTPHCVVPTT